MQARRTGTGLGVIVVALGLGALAWWLLGDRVTETDGSVRAPAAVTAAPTSPPAVPDMASLTRDAEKLDLASAVSDDEVEAEPPRAQADLPVTGPVLGRVVDRDARPITAASVRWIVAQRLEGYDWEQDPSLLDGAARTTTDGEGRFSISGPHRTGRRERFSFRGDSFPALLITAPGFATLAVALSGFEGGQLDVGTLALYRGATLVGRCVDDDGRPLQDVQLSVTVSRWPEDVVPLHVERLGHMLSQISEQECGADGRFRFDHLLPGRWQVTATRTGRVSASETFELEADGLTDAGDVLLSLGGSLRGRVVDAGGSPIKGASVFASPTPNRMNDYFRSSEDVLAGELAMARRGGREPDARSDADGRFVVTGQQPANLRLHAEAVGYEWGRLHDVSPGPDELTIVLPPQAVAILSVVDARDGAPVPGAVLTATRRLTADGGDEGSARTLVVRAADEGAGEVAADLGLSGDLVGRFVVERLGPVRNHVLVEAPGFAVRGFVLPGVESGGVLERVLSLQPEGVLAGRVIDGDGAPVARARITCRGPESARVPLPQAHGATDAEGRFEVRGLQPADWEVLAEADGHLPAWQVVALPQDDGSAEVAERLASLRDMELALGKAGVITGVLLDGDGGARPRSRVFFTRLTPDPDPWSRVAERYFDVQTDPAGRFRAENLVPGSWRLGQWLEVELPAGGELDVVLRPTDSQYARVSGIVRDGNGPVAGARVTSDRYLPGAGWWIPAENTLTDEAGRYELELKQPPKTRLNARAPGLGSVPAEPVELDFAKGQDYMQDFWLPGGHLSGRVTSGVGGPAVPGALVVLQPHAEDGLMSLMVASATGSGGQQDLWPRTDDTGRFELRHIGAGRYRLVVEHDEHINAVVDPVQLVEGGSASVTVALHRPARLVVGAFLPDGVPAVDGTQILLHPDEPYQRVSFGTSGSDGKMSKMLFNTEIGWPAYGYTKHGVKTFENMRAGAWTVQVALPGQGDDPDPTVLVEQRIVLSAGEDRRLDLIVPP